MAHPAEAALAVLRQYRDAAVQMGGNKHDGAGSCSQLAGSLRVLHAMAAAVLLSLAGGGGASSSGSERTAMDKRRQREALLQVGGRVRAS